SGLESLRGEDGIYVFHAGTAFKDGRIVTSGGRVLGVTATGTDLKNARARAYEAVRKVSFEKAFCRSDIGKAIDEVTA
ncbi:MAG: phosphoribosylamine--glycine ligase, partial [Lachnospiraceae bacterium]|nr:phosphoribosylamine--glycine ligase [Lachnospiraceae bacterium]